MKRMVKRAFKVQVFLFKVCSRAQQSLFHVANNWGLHLRCLFLSEQLNHELKQSLKETMTTKYAQKGYDQVTKAVDKLQQEVRA